MDSFKPDTSKIAQNLQSEISLKDFSQYLQMRFPDIVFRDEKMVKVLGDVEKISPSDSPVLILGETGTGKEVIAKAIHTHSGRVSKQLVPINCSAIPENILEAELFGYEKGAFTGADRSRAGILDGLNGGTLFLDEIGDMPLRLQVKLLRVLQEKKYRPLGSQKEKEVDVRFIAATHKDLDHEVKEKRFRADLFYRLNVLPICIPSLRERTSDIPCLLKQFVHEYCIKNQVKIDLTPEVIRSFVSYSWPGNVRELHNFVERICLMRGSGLIEKKDLPGELTKESAQGHSVDLQSFEDTSTLYFPESGIDLDAYLERVSSLYIKEALSRTQNNKKEAARLLSLNRTTLVERIKKRMELGTW